MDFFGMGIPEILVIMMLALILFGPGKLPEIAQGIGRAVREFRAATRELTSEFEQAFREVQASTAEVTASVLAVQDETRAALGEIASATQEVAQTVRADQALAPATTPTDPGASSAATRAATSVATEMPVTSPSGNGRREATKDDPLADLVDLENLLESPGSPKTSAPASSDGHWE
ncbi:MAG: twin-arginine translocase TatA/TatE family subunit [Thermomicrobium sp.]|nr:twin-arginine translocase TatA/TatE family subunit [Thermomicrobium sp.]